MFIGRLWLLVHVLRFWMLNKHSFCVCPHLSLVIGHLLAGCACFYAFWLINNHSFSVSMHFCLFTGHPFFWMFIRTPLAFLCVLFVYWQSFSWCSAFSALGSSISPLLHLSAYMLVYLPAFSELVVYKYSFNVSQRFYKFVEHPLCGCAFCCSISTTLAFLSVYWFFERRFGDCAYFSNFSYSLSNYWAFLAVLFICWPLFSWCACLCALGCSISTTLAFVCIFVCL